MRPEWRRHTGRARGKTPLSDTPSASIKGVAVATLGPGDESATDSVRFLQTVRNRPSECVSS